MARSLTESLQALIQDIPFGTRLFGGICIFLFVLGYLVPPEWKLSATNAPAAFCLHPVAVWTYPEASLYRMFTCAFFHAGLMHIAMNMMSFHPSGSGIEQTIGSLRYIHLILVLIFVPAALYVGLSWAAAQWPFRYEKLQNECAVGFSGVLFGLMALRAIITPVTTTTMLFFSVPSSLMPWVSLGVMQLIVPGVSFLGHLAGILTAYMYAYKWLEFVSLPLSTVQYLESLRVGRGVIQRLPGYLALEQRHSESDAEEGGHAAQPDNSSSGLGPSAISRCFAWARSKFSRVRGSGYSAVPTDTPSTAIEMPTLAGGTACGDEAEVVVDMAAVYRLMEMGFSRADSTRALRASANDIEAAVNNLDAQANFPTPRSALYAI